MSDNLKEEYYKMIETYQNAINSYDECLNGYKKYYENGTISQEEYEEKTKNITELKEKMEEELSNFRVQIKNK